MVLAVREKPPEATPEIRSLLGSLKGQKPGYDVASALNAVAGMEGGGDAILKEEGIVPLLFDCLRCEDRNARSCAAIALGKVAGTEEGREAVIPFLIECLKEEAVKYNAAAALGEIGKTDNGRKAVLPKLFECLKDKEARYGAAMALKGIAETEEGRKAVLPRLFECLEDKAARYGAAMAFREIAEIVALKEIAEIKEGREAVILPLLGCLKDAKSRYGAAFALKEISEMEEGRDAILKAEGAIPLLLGCLKDGEARLDVAFALGQLARPAEGKRAILKAEGAIPLLLECLKDREARLDVAFALGELAETEEFTKTGNEDSRLVVEFFREFYPETRGISEGDLLGCLPAILGITSFLRSTKSIAPFLTNPEVINAFSQHLKELSTDQELNINFQLAFFPAFLASHYIGSDFEKHLISLFACKTREEHEGWLKNELVPYLKAKFKPHEVAVEDGWQSILIRAAIQPALELEYYLDEEGELNKVRRIMKHIEVNPEDLQDFVTGLSYAYYFRTMPGGFIDDIPKGCHSRHIWGQKGAWYLESEKTCMGPLFSLSSEIGHFSGDLMGRAFGKRLGMEELEDRITKNANRACFPGAQNAIDFVYHIRSLGNCIVEHEMGDGKVRGDVMELIKQMRHSEELAGLTPSELYSIGRTLLGRFTPTHRATKEHADAAERLLRGLSQDDINAVVGATMLVTRDRPYSSEIIRPAPYETFTDLTTHALAERLSIDIAVKTAVLAYENSITISLLPHMFEHLKLYLIENADLKDGFDYRGVLDALGRLDAGEVNSWCMVMIFEGLFDLGESVEMEGIRCRKIRDALEELFPITKTQAAIAPRLIEAAAIHLMYERYGLETDPEKVSAALEEFDPRKETIEDVAERYGARKS